MLMLAGVRSHLTFSEGQEKQMPLFCLCLCCGRRYCRYVYACAMMLVTYSPATLSW